MTVHIRRIPSRKNPIKPHWSDISTCKIKFLKPEGFRNNRLSSYEGIIGKLIKYLAEGWLLSILNKCIQ